MAPVNAGHRAARLPRTGPGGSRPSTVAWGLIEATLVLVAVLAAAPALAQPTQDHGIDSQIFLPPAGQGTTFTVPSPTVPRHLTFDLGLDASYANHALVAGPGGSTVLLPSLFQGELLGAIGLFEAMELGVAVPVTLTSSASIDPQGVIDTTTSGHASLGDIRLELKVPILRGAFALSGRAVFGLPTGDWQHFTGVQYWTATPSVVAAYTLGKLTLGGELGYRMRRRATVGSLEYDDEIGLSGGARYAITPKVDGVAELSYRLGVGGRSFASNERPLEGDLGVRLHFGPSFTVDVGVGRGLADGYGAPAFRGFAIVRYATQREPCAAGPEDYDGYQDGDFCADPDNDNDGIPDTVDQCPNDPEDRDGFLDYGRLPRHRQRRRRRARRHRSTAPNQSEDRDGYQDDDGCPDLDNDGDGIPDGLDQCPMEPEDRDGYEDQDGCPEPGPERATVTVTDTRILISERIYFDFDADTIKPVSRPLLDQVAQVINQLPANKHVRVEGYSDNLGSPEYNLDLSYRRARSVVEYLVAQHVARSRLQYVGYGQRNSVAPNDTPEGRALNRRVEFTILEPSDERQEHQAAPHADHGHGHHAH